MIDLNGKNKYGYVYLGDTPIAEVYYGRHLIWPDIVYPEGGRYAYTTIMGTSGSSECKTFKENDDYLWYNVEDMTPEISRYINTFTIGPCISKINVTPYVGHVNFSDFHSLETVDISNSGIIDLKDNGAFRQTPISTFIMGDNVESIGDEIFQDCGNLKNISFSNKLRSIGVSAFTRCDILEEVNVPDSLEEIGYNIFTNCTNLKSVKNFENTKIRTISRNAFSGCTNLNDIVLSDATISIESGAFSRCSELDKINLENVTYIGAVAFNECVKLTDINLNDSILTIDDSTFSYTGLKTLKLPKFLTSIGNGAFYGCYDLSGEIVIPDKVVRINATAFYSSTSNIESIRMLPKTPPTLGTNVFTNLSGNNYPIYVPCESLDAYKSATNWRNYADRIVGYDC